eukprot:4204798-Pyramimonas_sp.AAC.1
MDGGVRSACIQQLRPNAQSELVGAPPDPQATNIVNGAFVHRRGPRPSRLSRSLGSRIMVHIASLQRTQEPTSVHVRRLSAPARQLLQSFEKAVRRPWIPMDPAKRYGFRGRALLRRRTESIEDNAVHCAGSL